MDAETIFFTLFVIWYFKQFHSSHHLIVSSIHFLKTAHDCINHYNQLIIQEISNYNSDSTDGDDTEVNANDVENTPDQVVVKYEDKYLQDVRRMDREFHFDNDTDFTSKTTECLESIRASYAKRRTEISKILGQIDLKLQIYEGVADDYVVYSDDQEDDANSGQTKEDIMKAFLEEKKPLLEEDALLLSHLETSDGQAECAKQAREETIKFFKDKKIEGLGNCCVMEHTPLGNVVMLYDKVRETFKYYSDNTIPYRYLEVVARKYVKQFNCRPIFVDMEEEIQLAEKQNQERKEKEELERKRKEETSKPSQLEEKRNVFAKFKSYNKEAGTGHVNTGAPPKNSLPNKPKTDKPDADYILKNNANRYTYEGRMANFSFIKKIDRKAVDKKAAMTFADFKKMKL